MHLSPELLWGVAGAIFGAGGYVTLLRLLKRDVDGLGRNYRKHEREWIVLLLTLAPEEDRKWLAEVMLKK